MAPADQMFELLARAEPCSLADTHALRALHAQFVAKELIEPEASSDAARLHALFDYALDSNLVSVVVHYVLEARSRGSGAAQGCSVALTAFETKKP